MQRGTDGGECQPRELRLTTTSCVLFEQDVATDDAGGDDDRGDDDADEDVSFFYFTHMTTAESSTNNVSPTC